MSTKLYTEDIDKTIDWGGDEKTGGLPVSGEKVQKFIKETLAKKFGYLFFDKDKIEGFEDVTGTNKYLIFADVEDYNEWLKSPKNNASKVLFNFDAPAPATIVISNQSRQVNTILLSDVASQTLSFDYLVKDNSDKVQPSRMSVAISINNSISGVQTLPLQTLDMVYGDDPIHYDFIDLGNYLTEGTNTVTITLTALEYNVSTSIIYQYRVLNLMISSTFGTEDPNGFYYFNGISLTNNEYFGTSITGTGTGQKFLRVFIDNENIYGDADASVLMGSASPQVFELNIQFRDGDGNLKSWATAGKHNIQFYFFVLDENRNEIKSQTLYYEFVLTEVGMSPKSYILFSRVLEQGQLVDESTPLTISSEQYNSMSIDYAVYDTSGRGNSSDGSSIIIDINLSDSTSHEVLMNTQASIPSGSTTTFDYTFQNYGELNLAITNTNTGGETVGIPVHVKKSSVEISEETNNLILKLSAMNRSNAEPAERRSVWEYEYVIPGTTNTRKYSAQFNDVLWNMQNGWIDNMLVLNNGASVTIPLNIFNLFSNANGLTFEIDFETADVQDDNAVIMHYGAQNGAHIYINACNAEMQSANRVNIHTNYKDGARQKIQFIYNGSSESQESPYLMYIVVNGILDRAIQFSNTDSVGTDSESSFTIGNLDGQATVKIHSIRVYNRSLTLDGCVNNYIADSDSIRYNYLRNDVYNDDGKTINVNAILNGDINIPVLTIYGDVTNSIVQVFNKKSNVPVDVLYRDPANPEFNFFVYDAWMSNQGTSSMNYPRRNFRLYFNKNNDAQTLRGYAGNDHYKYQTRLYPGLTDEAVISQIQSGVLDLSQPVNGITPLCNKKWQEEVNGSLTTIDKLDNYYEIDTVKARWFWHSGIKVYTKKETRDDEGNITNVEFKKIKNLTEEINKGSQLYSYGAYTRFKSKDLYTDRWTLKCDYAESSMTHNAGVGRLWGEVMRNVEIGDGGFSYDTDGKRYTTSTPCRTNAQSAAIQYQINTGREYGDIRTSCDGKPIVIVNRPRLHDSNGNFIEGQFGDPVFLGLYNIMTDKGSTPLFGFEDLKDDEGNVIFDASKVECWECLQNGSQLAQMSDIKTDDTDGSTVGYSDEGSDNEDRPLFKTYEARWPDNDDLNDTLTNNLETVIRFVNFCKDGVKVQVSGKDGYTLSDFTQITEEQAAYYSEHLDEVANNTLYIGVPATSYKDATAKFYRLDEEGNIMYDSSDRPLFLRADEPDEYAEVEKLIKKNKMYYFQDYASQNVTGSSFSKLFDEDDAMNVKVAKVLAQFSTNRPYVFTASEDYSEIEQVEQAYYENSGYNWYIFDNTYNRSDVTKEINNDTLKDEVYTGRVFTFDGKRVNQDGDQVNPNAWVTVYLTKNGSNYTYTNEFGESGERYASGEEVVIETGSGNVVSRGESFKGHTLFEYFKDKKYEHFDVWKLAAYYVYIMRFAACDQVIKNTMMTTEDGIHYYFINYDNDTILGVRNDGYLAYDWQITRDTYDYTIGSYAYAGFGSVLWNLLEQDSDFLAKVQTIATAMVTSNVLTYEIALDMFNKQQAGTWSERLYNNSEMYKYIGTYQDIDTREEGEKFGKNPFSNTKYLPFLQGSRASHRDWWLRHRFDLYDSKWTAGEYATNALEFYMGLNASPSNPQQFLHMVAGSRFYFTIQSNNVTLGNNFVELNADEEYNFITTENLVLGNPMKMFGTYKVKVLDFSRVRDSLGSSLNFNWAPEKGSMMKELILGGEKTLSEQNGCGVTTISMLDRLTSLEVLDIRTCSLLISTPDISNLGNLRQFLASDSNISSFLPAEGLNLEKVSLPDSITAFKVKNISFLTDVEGNYFRYSPNSALRTIEIIDCTGIDIIEFLDAWHKALKHDHVLMSNYSCTLSFDRIELPAEINGTDSLEWLNSLRTDLGKNAAGEDNLVIKKGIIKLYGHGENGSLTREDYDELRSIWPDEYFRADSGVHFDAEKSVFLNVSPLDAKSEEYLVASTEYDNTYSIVSGHGVKIDATVFPMSNERKLLLRPSYIDQYNRRAAWPEYTTQPGVFHYIYGNASESKLTNDNGTAKVTFGEYTNENQVTISLYEQYEGEAPKIIPGNDIDIVILPMVIPSRTDIAITKDGTNVSSRVNIDVAGVEQIFDISFHDPSNRAHNIHAKAIKATFGDSGSSSAEVGDLVTYLNDGESMQVGYTPRIQSGDQNVDIQVAITLDNHLYDGLPSTVLNTSIPIRLDTRLVDSIIIEKLDENTNTYVALEQVDGNYVDTIYLNELISGQRELEHRYHVKFNEDGYYNVRLSNMNINTNSITSFNNVLNGDKDSNGAFNEIIISSTRLDRKQSFLEVLDFEVYTEDQFNNRTSCNVLITVGCFYPDKVVLSKKENGVIDYNNPNVDLLKTENKTVEYKCNVYSLINGQPYVWGDEADEVSLGGNAEQNASHFIKDYPQQSLNNATLTLTYDDVCWYITQLGIKDVNGTLSFGNTLGFSFTTQDSGLIKTNIKAEVNINYNDKYKDTDHPFVTEFMVSRSSALAVNKLWINLESDKYYYLDVNGRFYDTVGLTEMSNTTEFEEFSTNPEKYIVGITYVYDGEGGNKSQVTFDPFMTYEKSGINDYKEKHYYWIDKDNTVFDKTFNIPNNERHPAKYMMHIPYNLTSEAAGDKLNNAQKLKTLYNWYSLICLGRVNDDTTHIGGRFSINSSNTYNLSTSGDRMTRNDRIFYYDIYKGYAEFEREFDYLSDNGHYSHMVFSVFDRYRNNLQVDGALLNENDIMILINHQDKINEALDNLGIHNVKLFDYENVNALNSEELGNEYSSHYDPEKNDTQNIKVFLCINLLPENYMPVLVCYKDEHDVLQYDPSKRITITNGNFIDNNTNKRYYRYSALFGPELNGYWINTEDYDDPRNESGE